MRLIARIYNYDEVDVFVSDLTERQERFINLIRLWLMGYTITREEFDEARSSGR